MQHTLIISSSYLGEKNPVAAFFISTYKTLHRNRLAIVQVKLRNVLTNTLQRSEKTTQRFKNLTTSIQNYTISSEYFATSPTNYATLQEPYNVHINLHNIQLDTSQRFQ